jgi:hypothetical protein
MAAASGDQVVRYLSEFFAAQGWIRQEKAKKGPDRLLTSRVSKDLSVHESSALKTMIRRIACLRALEKFIFLCRTP